MSDSTDDQEQQEQRLALASVAAQAAEELALATTSDTSGSETDDETENDKAAEVDAPKKEDSQPKANNLTDDEKSKTSNNDNTLEGLVLDVATARENEMEKNGGHDPGALLIASGLKNAAKKLQEVFSKNGPSAPAPAEDPKAKAESQPTPKPDTTPSREEADEEQEDVAQLSDDQSEVANEAPGSEIAGRSTDTSNQEADLDVSALGDLASEAQAAIAAAPAISPT